MIYMPDSLLEYYLLEDISMGDLTTRSLGLHGKPGRMTFTNRRPTTTSGIKLSELLLNKLGLKVTAALADGMNITEPQVLLCAEGDIATLHQGWKVVQNILEWSCGVAHAASELVQQARTQNPQVQIACTRKSIPGTRLLATAAFLDGGAIIHRAGCAETILLFANHRHCLPQPFDWQQHIEQLRGNAPEKKIMVEADNMSEAELAIKAKPDIIQLVKFSPQQILEALNLAAQQGFRGQLIAAGGINRSNIQDYAATGVPVLATSSPYYAKPADIKVTLKPN